MKMDTQKNMNLQNNISFLRIRPCDSDNEIYLNSRKKEGTSSFYIDKTVDLEKIHKKDFQTIPDININECKEELNTDICRESYLIYLNK